MTSGIGRRPGLTSKTLVSPHSHTGDDIVDGSIVNADIGAAAAIAQSKIANLTSDLAGKASITHTHSASDITTGTVAAARLGSGTADATTFLRGDQTWAAAGGSETLPASIIDAKGDVIVGTAADTAARLAVGSDGMVLIADSASTAGMLWGFQPVQANAFTTEVFPMTIASTYTHAGANASHAQRVVFYPVWMPKRRAITRLTVNVTTIEAGATARLGVFTCTGVNTSVFSGDLVVDAGLVSAATIGQKSLTVSLSLTPGMWVFAVWCSNHTTVRYGNPDVPAAPLGRSAGYLSPYIATFVNGVDYSAGLPSTIPAGQSMAVANVTAVPSMWGS